MVLFAGTESIAQPVEVISSERLIEIIDEKSPMPRIISFWATWCRPCVEEIPYLEEIHMTGKAEVILVSLDFMDELDTKVYKFVTKHELTSRICIINNVDYNSWINKVDESWSGAIPATLVINSVSGKRKFIEQPLKDGDLDIYLNEVKN
jgi:thiol-disulfide isomerase/thioredoxin